MVSGNLVNCRYYSSVILYEYLICVCVWSFFRRFRYVYEYDVSLFLLLFVFCWGFWCVCLWVFLNVLLLGVFGGLCFLNDSTLTS